MFFKINVLAAIVSFAATSSLVAAQDASVSPLNGDGRIVDFQRDIAPIFVDRCLKCHGPKNPKNDFRIDQKDYAMDYIEAGDADGSSMYMDYMLTDDVDMLMPPVSQGGPLSAGELALIRVWINEGADWPDDATVVSKQTTDDADPLIDLVPIDEPSGKPPLGLFARLWTAGLPASRDGPLSHRPTTVGRRVCSHRL